jgi:hypothetical protein
MLFAENVWTVYGIGLHTERLCAVCQDKVSTLEESTDDGQSCPMKWTPTMMTSNLSSTATVPIAPSKFTPSSKLPVTSLTLLPFVLDPTHQVSAMIHGASSYKPSITSTSSASASTLSSPPTKQIRGLSKGTKVGIGVGVGVPLFMIVLMAIFEACYWRGKRRQKAMLRAVEEVEIGTRIRQDKGSEERMVLESNISIVFEDTAEEEDEEEEAEERGRNGLSLPRRNEY